MTTILVTGPEASGNRMLCRMLTEAGATVLHHPMPMSTHAHRYPDGLWTDFATLEWDAAVVITRDPIPTIGGQVAQGHARDIAHATERTRKALVNIYGQLGLTDRPWWPVTYEGLARREAVLGLCGLLGLDGEPITEWRDANAKWYGGPAWSDHTRLWERPRALSV